MESAAAKGRGEWKVNKGKICMKATEILMSEHRVIERVLTALERAAESLEAEV
jgi:hypothetical protein